MPVRWRTNRLAPQPQRSLRSGVRHARVSSPTAGHAHLRLFRIPPAALVATAEALAQAGSRPSDDDACAPGVALGDVRIAVGGQYRLMANGSNFGFHQRQVGAEPSANRIANQRCRTRLNVHERAAATAAPVP